MTVYTPILKQHKKNKTPILNLYNLKKIGKHNHPNKDKKKATTGEKKIYVII